MVNHARRSSTILKKSRRTPGNKTKEFYKRKKVVTASCTLCHVKLAGVDTTKSSSKTQKKAGRKFSGKLCHKCAAQVIKLQARVNAKQITLHDTDMKYRKFLKE